MDNEPRRSIRNKLPSITNWLATSENSLTNFAACLLAVLVLVVITGIFSRVSGIRIPGVMETSSFILIALVFLPLSEVTRTGSHIRVQFINQHLSVRMKRRVEWLTGVIAVAAVALIAVLCWNMFFETLQSGSVTVGSPHISLWIPQLPIAIGLSLAGLRMIIDLWIKFRSSTN